MDTDAMRTKAINSPFYRLGHDDRDDLEVVNDYEMGDFDLTTLWVGQPLTGQIPNCVRLALNDNPEDKASDYLGNPISWQIFSDRAAGAVRSLVEHDVQFFDPPIYDARGRRVHRYRLLNPTNVIACLDLERSDVAYDDDGEISLLSEACVRTSAAKGHHMFRPTEYPYVVIVSQEFAERIAKLQPAGFAFFPCRIS